MPEAAGEGMVAVLVVIDAEEALTNGVAVEGVTDAPEFESARIASVKPLTEAASLLATSGASKLSLRI